VNARTEAEIKAEGVREFVAWVATHRAYNGSDYPHGQSLYNECLNGELPQWANDWIADALATDTAAHPAQPDAALTDDERERVDNDLWWGYLCPALANINAIKKAQSDLVALGADWAEAGRILSHVQSFYVNAAHKAARHYLAARAAQPVPAPEPDLAWCGRDHPGPCSVPDHTGECELPVPAPEKCVDCGHKFPHDERWGCMAEVGEGGSGSVSDSVFCKCKRAPAPEGCPTLDCPGDWRYAAPGRGHLPECHYPLPAPEGQVERLCEVMHDAYEAAAATEGWETQERSRKPWADVPEANKATMRAAVSALLTAIPAAAPAAVEGVETVEWMVRLAADDSLVLGGSLREGYELHLNREDSLPLRRGEKFRRTRLHIPDRVSEWTPVEPETSEPETCTHDETCPVHGAVFHTVSKQFPELHEFRPADEPEGGES
jgi:hypothetical protein